MAVLDSTSFNVVTIVPSSTSWTHTCSGSLRVLYVALTIDNSTSSQTFTGATYNGVSMTLIFSGTTSGSGRPIYIWRLVAPATGTNTITISWSGTLPSQGIFSAASFTSVDQTTPESVSPITLTTGNSLSPASGSITGASGKTILGFLAYNNVVPAGISEGSGQTRLVAYAPDDTRAMMSISSKAGSGSSTTMAWTKASSANEWGATALVLNSVTGPAITDTSDDTPTSGTTLTINGQSFGTQTGSAQVTVGGVVVTPSSWSSTQIQIPLTIGNNRYGVNVPIVVRDSGGTSSSAYNVQIQPASGVNYVSLSGTLASSGDRITATPDLASGDQVEWSNVVGGTISDVTVNADASFVASSGVISFDVRVNDGTGWGTYATQLLVAGRGIVRPLVRSLTSNLVTNLVG